MVLFEIWSLGQQPFSGVLDANKVILWAILVAFLINVQYLVDFL